MKKRNKKLLSSLIMCGLLIAPTQSLAETIPPGFHKDTLPITIHADGKFVQTDVDPVVQNGRTLLPLRAAGEAIGVQVNWNQSTQTASAKKDGTTVEFKLNSTTYYVNGTAKQSDVAPVIINNRILLPIRVLSETLNAKVNWDNVSRDVNIDTDAEDAPSVTIPVGSYPEAETLIKKYYVAPDASDPLVGSWKHLGKTDEGFTKYTYHFISKNGNGTYNDIWATVSDHYLQDLTQMKDVVLRKNTLSGALNNLTANNAYDSVIYSQGRNMGYMQPQSYFYKIDARGMFVATGYYISSFGQSYIRDLNDVYIKY